MNFKNLMIGSQLRLAFLVLSLLLITLGGISYFQISQLFELEETLYQHPMSIRSAIGELKSSIFSIRSEVSEIVLKNESSDYSQCLSRIEFNKSVALRQIDTLYSQFLGSRYNLDSLRIAYLDWITICDETVHQILAGERNQKTISNNWHLNRMEIQLPVLQRYIKRIDVYAKAKAATLIRKSYRLKLNFRLIGIGLMVLVSACTGLFYMVLLRSIKRPLSELTDVAQRFKQQDMGARCHYESGNEFGVLSASFNTMAESIQFNLELNQKINRMAESMLGENQMRSFFVSILGNLAELTDSQIAAVFLGDPETGRFDLFESIGLGSDAKIQFSADRYEGEIGLALATQTIQIINQIPENTPFAYYTIGVRFVPREIMTIPLVANRQTIAVITLASLHAYDLQSRRLTRDLWVTLSARTAGILAYQKMLEFSRQLESQNRELETQKKILTDQAQELSIQNRELEIQKKQLDEAGRLKTIFLSTMSHELRTPLNSVIALSGILYRRLKDKIPVEEHSYLEVIERNGKHLLSLINNILDLSRIESGREEINRSRFSLNQMVSEVVTMLEPVAVQKGIELRFIPLNPDIELDSDAEKTRQILLNVVGNGIKFTEQGHVIISGLSSDQAIDLIVSDTGIGMDENQLDYIFDAFRQADVGIARKYGGTGLGLSIAKKLADLMGGTITARSTPGRGTDFMIRFPRVSSNPNPSPRLSSPERPNHPMAQRLAKSTDYRPVILVVEDNPDNRLAIKGLLSENYRVLEAENGRIGVEMAVKANPDLILMDIIMPEMDGVQAFKAIRKYPDLQHIPILALTASVMTADREAILAYGFDAFIAKPIDPQQFEATIDGIVYGK